MDQKYVCFSEQEHNMVHHVDDGIENRTIHKWKSKGEEVENMEECFYVI